MQMTAEIRVRVPAADAWDLIGTRFGDIAAWASPITASSLDVPTAGAEAVRTCRVSGFGAIGEMVLQERLLAFDPAARSFTYHALSGLPSFIRGATNRWTVRGDGPGACFVRTQATLRLAWWLRPMGPLIALRLRRDGALVLEELAHRLETGRPHPRTATRPWSSSSSPGVTPSVER